MRRYKESVFCFTLILLLTGCQIYQVKEEKLKNLSYEVVSEEAIPKGMKQEIERQKRGEFRIAYRDESGLFLGRGYGVKQWEGYHIQVKELYESENAIIMQTILHGPEYDRPKKKKQTTPYLVIQVKDEDKYIKID